MQTGLGVWRLAGALLITLHWNKKPMIFRIGRKRKPLKVASIVHCSDLSLPRDSTDVTTVNKKILACFSVVMEKKINENFYFKKILLSYLDRKDINLRLPCLEIIIMIIISMIIIIIYRAHAI